MCLLGGKFLFKKNENKIIPAIPAPDIHLAAGIFLQKNTTLVEFTLSTRREHFEKNVQVYSFNPEIHCLRRNKMSTIATFLIDYFVDALSMPP